MRTSLISFTPRWVSMSSLWLMTTFGTVNPTLSSAALISPSLVEASIISTSTCLPCLFAVSAQWQTTSFACAHLGHVGVVNIVSITIHITLRCLSFSSARFPGFQPSMFCKYPVTLEYDSNEWPSNGNDLASLAQQSVEQACLMSWPYVASNPEVKSEPQVSHLFMFYTLL